MKGISVNVEYGRDKCEPDIADRRECFVLALHFIVGCIHAKHVRASIAYHDRAQIDRRHSRPDEFRVLVVDF